MDKKIKDPKKRIPVEVPFRRYPEIQTTEYVFEGSEPQEPTKTAQSVNSFDVPSKSDVLGSYTGNPADMYEVPVQDADDL